MSAYDALAASYDTLTEDVQYEKRADFIEKLFRRSRIPVHTVLDLACGTGAMTWLLTGRGYELIAVDNSEDMLAKRGAWRVPEKTLFLLPLLGGSLGALLGMRVFHHKTKHWYFVWGIPLILLAQIALAVWLYVK